MKQSEGLVRFISRAFGAATIAIVVGSGVLLSLFWVRNRDESWARRSSDVGRLAREIEIAALQRQAALRGHALLGGRISAEALGLGDSRTSAQLDSLRRLTADLPEQQRRAERIAAAFARWDSTLLRQPLSPTGRALTPGVARDVVISAGPVFRAIAGDVAALVDTENRLYADRIEAAHDLDQGFLVTALIAVAVVLITLHLLRRRLLAQAHELGVSAAALDLRNAQLIDHTGQMEQMIDALQASETRFRTLVGSLHDVVFTLGREKRYTGMFGGGSAENPERYTGFIGKTASDILGPELGQVHLDAAERALQGETATYDWAIDDAGTTRHYSVTVSPLRGPAGEIRGVVGINRDQTEHRAREKALSDARDQLRQAQRLDALGQLAGGVAHDFNNLLTVILSYAALLQENAEPGTDEARSIEEIRAASERAAALTRQLLAFSRRQVLQPRAIDLNDTVREVERMLRRVLPPNIALETVLAPDLGFVMADPGQIEQVLVNLAINARDAMPDGGQLSITTANVERGFGITGSHVLITVRDTGEGMTAETLAQVFEPFFTTKAFGKGAGLGLAMVHGIVEQSGGRITVESEPGRGTAFFIRLPRHVDVAADLALPVTSEIDLRGSETVLLVDDNEELRRVVKRMLVRAGYRVVEAANGAAAVAHLDRTSDVDIVLSDVMMPEMSGRGVLEAIRQRHRGVRVLFMSGHNYDTAIRGMAKRGDVSFIEKPFSAEKLLRRLREVLNQPLGSGVP